MRHLCNPSCLISSYRQHFTVFTSYSNFAKDHILKRLQGVKVGLVTLTLERKIPSWLELESVYTLFPVRDMVWKIPYCVWSDPSCSGHNLFVSALLEFFPDCLKVKLFYHLAIFVAFYDQQEKRGTFSSYEEEPLPMTPRVECWAHFQQVALRCSLCY